jgi:hypothetical protein
VLLAGLLAVSGRAQDTPPDVSGDAELAASGGDGGTAESGGREDAASGGDGLAASGDDGAAAAGGDRQAASGGSAEGWLEVARERTVLRYAYVLGESGDGASGELRVVLADRELTEEAIASAAERDALAARDEARSLVAALPGDAGEIEVWFHHPRLPRGISLRGLAHFVPESESVARLEGRLVLSGEGTNFEAWFSAPIVRRETGGWPEIAAAARIVPPERSFDEVLRDGSGDEIDAALAASPDLESVGGMSALAIAADAGNLAAVTRLLAAGAAPDYRADRSAMSPLMLAAGRRHPEVVQALLAAGANPKLRTSSGFTPLYHAVLEAQLENARLLIEAGADLARDRDLLLTTAREKGNAAMTSFLESVELPPAQ